MTDVGEGVHSSPGAGVGTASPWRDAGAGADVYADADADVDVDVDTTTALQRTLGTQTPAKGRPGGVGEDSMEMTTQFASNSSALFQSLHGETRRRRRGGQQSVRKEEGEGEEGEEDVFGLGMAATRVGGGGGSGVVQWLLRCGVGRRNRSLLSEEEEEEVHARRMCAALALFGVVVAVPALAIAGATAEEAECSQPLEEHLVVNGVVVVVAVAAYIMAYVWRYAAYVSLAHYACVGLISLFGVIWNVIGVVWYSWARNCSRDTPSDDLETLKRAVFAYIVITTFLELFSCSLLYCYGYWARVGAEADPHSDEEWELVQVDSTGKVINAPHLSLVVARDPDLSSSRDCDSYDSDDIDARGEETDASRSGDDAECGESGGDDGGDGEDGEEEDVAAWPAPILPPIVARNNWIDSPQPKVAAGSGAGQVDVGSGPDSGPQTSRSFRESMLREEMGGGDGGGGGGGDATVDLTAAGEQAVLEAEGLKMY